MNKLSYKLLLPAVAGAITFASIATPVFAWPTRGQEVTCTKIHWEMQNDTNKTYQFVGKVTEPISFETTQSVKPNDWGVLDKSWNLTGNVNVKATISMGGDTRTVQKTLNCPVPTPTPSPSPTPSPKPSPTPSPTPSPKPSPSPTPSPSASPSPTPTPSPSPTPTPTPEVSPSPTPCTNCQEQHQEQNNTQTVNVVVPQVLPATGLGVLGMTTIFGGGPLGLMLAKYGKGRISGKREESLSEFATREHNDRISQ